MEQRFPAVFGKDEALGGDIVRLIVLAAALFAACVNAPQDSISQPENPPIIQGDTTNLLVYYSDCSQAQPMPNPVWCDFYDDGGACCTWVDSGFHEEWCQYPDNWCWEVNDMWQE